MCCNSNRKQKATNRGRGFIPQGPHSSEVGHSIWSGPVASIQYFLTTQKKNLLRGYPCSYNGLMIKVRTRTRLSLHSIFKFKLTPRSIRLQRFYVLFCPTCSFLLLMWIKCFIYCCSHIFPYESCIWFNIIYINSLCLLKMKSFFS